MILSLQSENCDKGFEGADVIPGNISEFDLGMCLFTALEYT